MVAERPSGAISASLAISAGTIVAGSSSADGASSRDAAAPVGVVKSAPAASALEAADEPGASPPHDSSNEPLYALPYNLAQDLEAGERYIHHNLVNAP
ncbi:hypothetical protein LTR85_008199 [Meristemomyces frigidus]|nr:hypothetical protein LTR85_008199 [Meristemomyces frigidus]